MYLEHHGVLGQKWGVIRARGQTNREKAKNVAKRKNISSSDIKRAEYAAKPLYNRVGAHVAGAVISNVMSNLLSGRNINYATMSRSDKIKNLRTISTTAAFKFGTTEALAKSSLSKYQQSGRSKNGVKDRIITREDAIEMGIKTGMFAIPLLKMNALRMTVNRSKNEERVNSWGANILPTKASEWNNIMDLGEGMSLVEKNR